MISRAQTAGVKPLVTPALTDSVRKSDVECFVPGIALKTNVLYDALLTPNIEVERWLDRKARFSVMGEFNFPWYTWHNHARAYEVAEFGLETRYWVARRFRRHNWRPLTGWFVGLYGATGYYDLEWNYKGHRGNFWSTGLSLGFAWPISKHWNMELSAAGGYLSTKSKRYEDHEHNNTLLHVNDNNTSYIGPTKLKVSFAWVIPFPRRLF